MASECSGHDSIVSIEEDKNASIFSVELRPQYVFSSFRDDVVQKMINTDNEVPTHFGASLHLQAGTILNANTEAGSLYPNIRQGVGVAVNIFDHPDAIGVPLALYVFQGAPVINMSHGLCFDYEWNFGISAGWKKCDLNSSRSNLIVGSYLNAYINLGLGLGRRVGKNLYLRGGLDLTHFSNGNTSFPNPGVNMIGLSLAASGAIGELSSGTPFRTRYSESADTVKRKPMSFDLTLYGAWRRRVYRGGEEPVLLKGRYGVAGINLSPMWDIVHYFRSGVSVDFQWDASSGLKKYYISGDATDNIRFSNPSFFSGVCGGISARAELAMPFFSLNLGIGYNLFGPAESRATYQMANLKLYLTRSVFLNVGYQLLNFKRQNNLMLGLGYTFRSRRPSCSTFF